MVTSDSRELDPLYRAPGYRAVGVPVDEQQGIDAFWRWWADNLGALTETVDRGMTPELIQQMSERVHDIHADLQWEFGRGVRARHGLAVTGAGSSALRVVAERWRRSSPGDSDTFEFHTTRQPAPPDQVGNLSIQLQGGPAVAFGECRIGVEEDAGHRRLSLEVFHPAFGGLPEGAANQITFLILDNAIGEDAVERWIGGIGVVDAEPADAVDLRGLRERVDALPARWPPGESSWTLAMATHPDGRKALFTVDAALKRWDHPTLDVWCTVDLPYPDRGDGWPSEEDREALQTLESALVASLGADAAHVGHRIGLGSHTILLYTTAEGSTRIRAWQRGQSREVRLSTEPDPGWEQRPQV